MQKLKKVEELSFNKKHLLDKKRYPAFILMKLNS
jgi:hypothetical protein